MNSPFQKYLDPRYTKLFKIAEQDSIQANVAKASKSADEFLKAYPKDAHANYFMAVARLQSDDKQSACHHAAIAYNTNPNSSDFAFLLARIYLDLRLFEYAAPLLYKAVRQHENNYKLQWAIGNFLFEIGKGPEANQHYQNAMAMVGDQEDRHLIAYDYATSLNTQALKVEAEEQYKIFGQKPANAAKALEILSKLHKYMPDSEMAKQVEAYIDDPKIDNVIRSELLLSLGKMYENAKQYDEAYDLWVKSRALKSAPASRFESVKYFEELHTLYTKEFFDAVQGSGSPINKSIFVVGMPRSGTTLTEQIIGAHQQCYGAGELGRLHMLEAEFTKNFSGQDNFAKAVQFCKSGEIGRISDTTLSLLNKLSGPAVDFVIDKTPNHYASIGFSTLCFPNTKYIHCQRHPADSFISAFQNNMTETHSYSYDQEAYVQAYLNKERLMAHWRKLFPDKIFELQYERLVQNPEETVRAMLAFLGLPWDDNCMKFFEKKTMVKTFSLNQVRNPIYTSSVYRWKNYEKHLGPLFAALKAANFEYPEA